MHSPKLSVTSLFRPAGYYGVVNAGTFIALPNRSPCLDKSLRWGGHSYKATSFRLIKGYRPLGRTQNLSFIRGGYTCSIRGEGWVGVFV